MIKKVALMFVLALLLAPIAFAATLQVYGEMIPALPNNLKVRLEVNGTTVYNGVIKDSKFGYETPIFIEMQDPASRISVFINDIKVDEFSAPGPAVKRYIPINAQLYEQITGKKFPVPGATQGTTNWMNYLFIGLAVIAGIIVLTAIVLLIYKFAKRPRAEHETEAEPKIVEEKPVVKEVPKEETGPFAKVKGYIKRQRAAGKSKEEIKQTLLEIGWPEKVVDDLLK
jgi:hypothetical protein